jgi:hypothetical protein
LVTPEGVIILFQRTLLGPWSTDGAARCWWLDFDDHVLIWIELDLSFKDILLGAGVLTALDPKGCLHSTVTSWVRGSREMIHKGVFLAPQRPMV